MIYKCLLVVSKLIIALFFSLLPPTGALAQESDPGQADEGSTSESKPGITVIVDAAGEVQIIDKPGAVPRPAHKGDRIPVEGTIVTGAGGQANLALSNGAFFQILENSSFSIAQFEQSSFAVVFADGGPIKKQQLEKVGADEAVVKSLDASEESWNELPSEPTESKTNFALNYGTMIGESKKLKPGSEMQITTPIGSAGIRGTIWRMTIQRVGGANANQFRVNLDVSEGRVDFGSQDGSRSVQVRAGFSMNIQATVLPTGMVFFDSIATARLTPERAQVLALAVQEASQVQQMFAAALGSPDVLINTLQALQGVDVNNPQAMADATLSLLTGDAAQIQQISNIVSALIITRAEPFVAQRVAIEVVSALLTQSPNLAPSVVGGVVATTTMAAKNGIARLAFSQILTRAAVVSAATSAPGQVAALTASGVSVATTRGTETIAPAIASAVVGAAITSLPTQAGLIAAWAINSAARSNAKPAVVEVVISAIATSVLVNAAYAEISNGADQKTAERAAAEVAEAIRKNSANTPFSGVIEFATDASMIQESINQAIMHYERGEAPNTDGSTGIPGGAKSLGDTTYKSKVEIPLPGQPNESKETPKVTTGGNSTTKSKKVIVQATPTPTPTPHPSNR